jgi:REP element-mobilizing transposase RayT
VTIAVMVRRRARQLAFDLRAPARWGGARPGAGRKSGPRPRDPHRRRDPLAARHPCHVTLKVRADLPSLRRPRVVAELERRWRVACERGRFRLVHYSVQADHAHLIVEAASAYDLSCGLKALAARFARAANRVFRRSGRVLADRAHVRVLRTPREVRRAIAYVLLNARRHAAKAGRAVRAWIAAVDPASSGRWFEGWRTPQVRARDAPAVAGPRTWLLAVGWRRHGLIDPGEVPGAGR